MKGMGLGCIARRLLPLRITFEGAEGLHDKGIRRRSRPSQSVLTGLDHPCSLEAFERRSLVIPMHGMGKGLCGLIRMIFLRPRSRWRNEANNQDLSSILDFSSSPFRFAFETSTELWISTADKRGK